MNTVIVRLDSIALPPSSWTAFGRFVWKELRTLRSFWLAVAALAVAGQWLTTRLASPGSDLPAILFASALGAAVVYAVGTAATLFAVEHEEETYDFLSALPARWSPMFWGKLFAAGASAAALALVLSLIAVPMAGPWPAQAKMLEMVSLYGLAIPEVLLWGTFFSLLLKRPLVAALLAMVAELVAVHLTVNLVPALFIPDWYLQTFLYATPFRLGVVLVVLAVDLWLARRWWPAALQTRPMATISVPKAAHALHFPRLRILGRLVWQTWRQSWPMMAWMLVLTFCIQWAWVPLLSTYAPMARWNPSLLLSAILPLAGPAIYSSAMLHADQRSQHCSFLGVHGANGRDVWFCRLLVWSLVYMVPAILPQAIFWLQPGATFSVILANAWLCWLGLLPGLALGQFCALTVRQNLVAAFLALLLACLFAAWAMIVWVWQLPFLAFLLPIPLGFLLASWLRAPDWLTGRNSVGGWSKVALAIVLPIVLVAASVPRVRLAQVPEVSANLVRGQGPAGLRAAQAVGDQLLQIGRTIVAAGSESDDAVPQEQLQRILSLCDTPAVRFPDLEGHLQGSSGRILGGSNLAVSLELLATLSRAGNQSTEAGELDQALEYYLAEWRLYGFLRCGQTTAVYLEMQASVLLYANLYANRLLLWAQHPEQTPQRIKEAIGRLDLLPPWSQSWPADSSYFPPDPLDNIWADHRQQQDLLEERGEPPMIHNTAENLAYLANRLPFERQRSIRVLTALTLEREKKVQQMLQHLEPVLADHAATKENFLARRAADSNVPSPPPAQRNSGGEGRVRGDKVLSAIRPTQTSAIYHSEQLRHIVQQTFSRRHQPGVVAESQLPFPLGQWLRTSYLLKTMVPHILEQDRTFLRWLVDSQVRQAGLKTQLALIAWRLEQDEYPESLDLLTPDYLPYGPIDLYAGRSFQYRRAGVPESLPYYKRISGRQRSLEPNQPFFWSVGPANASLVSQEVAFAENGSMNRYFGYGGEGGMGGYGGGEGGYGEEPSRSAEAAAENELEETDPKIKKPKTRTLYSFQNQESDYGHTGPLVFPLPE